MASASELPIDVGGAVRFVRKVGEGAAGTVFEVERDGERLAAKLFADVTLFEREQRALRLAAPVWSPGWRGAGRARFGADELAYLLLTWAEGEPLDALGDEAGARAPRSFVWGVLHGVGRALAELHTAGIRHGDVKPSNVLWRWPAAPADAPGGTYATLIDASLAHAADEPLIGLTPAYAAPELVHAPSSLAADVYALGKVVAEHLGSEALDEELRALIVAMQAQSPGARPTARFVADRAAAKLGLLVSADEAAARRARAVRAAYLRVRGTQLISGFSLAAGQGGPVAEWLAPLAEPGAPALAPMTRWQQLQWIVEVTGSALAHVPALFTDEHVLGQALLDGWPKVEVPRPRSDDWMQCALDLDGYAESIERGAAPRVLRSALAERLLERGELTRAGLLLETLPDEDAPRLRAELARRRGEHARSGALVEGVDDDAARALRARLAWDAGHYDEAERLLGRNESARTAEVLALCQYARGAFRAAAATCEAASPAATVYQRARLLGVQAMAQHAEGDPEAALKDFVASQRLANECGAVAEEATAATGAAAAATDAGQVDVALGAATQAGLLWLRLEQPARAARALLSRATALMLVGARFEAREAAEAAHAQAVLGKDRLAELYAELALLEVEGLGAESNRARAAQLAAAARAQPEEVRLRILARLLAWDRAEDTQRSDARARDLGGVVAWDWFAHRARFSDEQDRERAIGVLEQLPHAAAPADVRLLAYENVMRALADDGERAAPWRARARELSAAVAMHVPKAYAASFEERWRGTLRASGEAVFKEEQWLQIERLMRLLHGGNSATQVGSRVLDALLLWTGAERGILLVKDEDDSLRVQVARNVAREDLSTEELSLSRSLAAEALERGEVVVAHVDPAAEQTQTTRSIHALRLRSILVVPLLVRGVAHGVLYLDDRSRMQAFAELDRAWLRALAAQAAHALESAEERGRLERALRRAERAEADLAQRVAVQSSELATLQERLQGDEHKALRGQSAGVVNLRHAISRVAGSDLLVLVRGESGTGKELVARALHEESERAGRAFVSENCAALPEALLESTLFGHVRGAFTGAVNARAGLFEQAHRGTLFLDEVGEMSLAMQAKLLRVLETGELRPVGGERARKVDVRVIAATHRDLEAMVRQGSFRQDLWFRLAVVELRVPPLRERREDIPLLVAHFVAKHAAGAKPSVSREAMEKLAAFAWPGNVRQLENEVRKLLVFASGTVGVEDLSEAIRDASPALAAAPSAGEQLTDEVSSLRERMDALEAQLVADALERTAWNRSRAAEMLGVSRFGLQKMIRRLGLRPPN